jgi:intracellular septation protein
MADTGKTPRKRTGWVRPAVDYGPLVAFLIGFLITRDLQKATWVIVVASAVALAVGFAVERRIAPVPLIAGLAALVFGGLALIFHDPRLLKIKPTILNTVFAVLLFGGLLLKKTPLKTLMGDAIALPDAAWRSLSIRYGAFFLVVAVLNEIVWRTQPDATWVWFKFPGLTILTLVFSLSQVPFMMKHLEQGKEAFEDHGSAEPESRSET